MSNRKAGTAGTDFEALLEQPVKAVVSVWEYRLYVTPSGRNDIAKWDAKLSARARAKRNTNMKFLRDKPATQWSRPSASPISDNVYVIRFKDENGSEHRMFGYHDLQYHAFVICFEGYEKDNVYYPTDYEERVKKFRTEIAGKFDERTIACTWPVK